MVCLTDFFPEYSCVTISDEIDFIINAAVIISTVLWLFYCSHVCACAFTDLIIERYYCYYYYYYYYYYY